MSRWSTKGFGPKINGMLLFVLRTPRQKFSSVVECCNVYRESPLYVIIYCSSVVILFFSLALPIGSSCHIIVGMKRRLGNVLSSGANPVKGPIPDRPLDFFMNSRSYKHEIPYRLPVACQGCLLGKKRYITFSYNAPSPVPYIYICMFINKIKSVSMMQFEGVITAIILL